MQKEELQRGKANSKRNLDDAVPGRCAPRRSPCQGWRKGNSVIYELMHGPGQGFWQGGDGDFGRVGE